MRVQHADHDLGDAVSLSDSHNINLFKGWNDLMS